LEGRSQSDVFEFQNPRSLQKTAALHHPVIRRLDQQAQFAGRKFGIVQQIVDFIGGSPSVTRGRVKKPHQHQSAKYSEHEIDDYRIQFARHEGG
jgi:hypothetical protein